MSGRGLGSSPDVLIVGGGIVGLFAARALLLEGCTVVVIDRHEPARQASWAAGGILSALKPWKMSGALSHLTDGATHLYRDICDELLKTTGQDSGFAAAGMLLLPPWEQALFDWLDASSQDYRKLASDECEQLLPGLPPAHSRALLLGDRATVRPPRLCRALLAWLCTRPGFALHTGVSARTFKSRGTRVDGLVTDSGSWQAGDYLVAAGPWSSQLLPQMQETIFPVRGQMIAYKTGLSLPPISLMAEDAYAVLRPEGLVLVGSTLEEVGFDAATTVQGRDLLMRRAADIFPSLKGRDPDYHWAGLRPGAGRPLIGRIAPFENLWLGGGHYREGIAGAPRTADLLAALMVGRTPPLDPELYAPG